jgi:hypothetical protein
MTAARRPAVAHWLLTWFVGGPMRESIIGDIEEQFVRGRSSSWYWRQVLVAIVGGLQGDLRERPYSLILSVIVAAALIVAWVESTSLVYEWALHRWLDAWNRSPLFVFWIPFGGGTCLVWCLGSAFIARLSTRRSGRPAVLTGLLLSQIMLSLWLTRDFWLNGAFTTAVSPRLWVPNFLWAAVVLIGMPVSTVLGALWAPTRQAGSPIR